ncbi:putative epoxide hydrolase 2 [Boeremia exigua]|uniref:putative epoxide hydrolase 2 n=1 Tax=Boeremia exigua TaxID=749465 RepID=UPI001E8EC60B|nr:putative epoxide hydrolase 2 [Boeremia exigua]KAH6638715.1 putative epoxide hydrolase 2 [Boeremia exigua]
MIPTLKACLLINSFTLALGAVLKSRAENTTCQFNVNLDTADIANTSYVHMMKNAKLPASGRTYRYAIKAPLEKEKPHLLFLHGFPESSYSWINQIEYFTRRGYGIIAPDLLGTGGTDKPIELEAYNLKTMSAEVAELLDCEGIEKVVAVSHDLGSFLLSRLHTYQSKYLSALALLDIGYIGPGVDLNQSYVEAYNSITQAGLGYPVLGYWYYHNEPDAHTLMDANLNSMYSLYYTSNTTNWVEHFNKVGMLQKWLAADQTAEYGNEFITNSTREQWVSITRAQGGLEAPLKWYKAFLQGINSADEDDIRSTSGKIEQPSLFIAAEQDTVGIPAAQLSAMLPYAPAMQIRTIDAGHFVHVEKAREVNEVLYDFFQSL